MSRFEIYLAVFNKRNYFKSDFIGTYGIRRASWEAFPWASWAVVADKTFY